MTKTTLPLKDEQYIDLIANIGKENNNLIWWSTWASSKNRYSSFFGDYLQKYKKKDSSIVQQILISCKYLTKIFFLSVLSKFLLKNKISSYIQLTKEKKIYLIKTFAYRHSLTINHFIDPFFGSINSYLADKDIYPLTIFDPIKCEFTGINRSKSYLNVFPYFTFLTLKDFLWVCISLLRNLHEKLRLSNEISLSQADKKYLKYLYFREKIDPNMIHTLLYYRTIKNLSKIFQISDYLYTYENNPWEKVGILAFRQFSHLSTIRGYQHSAISKSCLNLFQGIDEQKFAPTPDCIITLGEITSSILKKWKHNTKLPIIAGPALRYTYLEQSNIVSDQNICNKTIVVALDGAAQATDLAKYIIHQAENMQEWNFILRTHPAYPLSRCLTSQEMELLPRNVHITKNLDALDDLREASFLIYWATTLSIEALFLGIPLLRFDIDQDTNNDPLFDFHFFKWNINGDKCLLATIKEISKKTPIEYQDLKSKAINHAKRYFNPANDFLLSKFF